MKHQTRNLSHRLLSVTLIFLLAAGLFTILPAMSPSFSVQAASAEASARVDASGGAVMRKSPSTVSGKVMLVKDNAKITILNEVFTTKKSTCESDRWYYVSTGGKKGYIRADLVSGISYASIPAVTTDTVNYRSGAGAKMPKKGSVGKGKSITVQLAASNSASKDKWYRVRIGSSSFYMSASYIEFKSSSSSKSSSKSSSAPAFSSGEDISLSGIAKPVALQIGKGFTVQGRVEAPVNISKVVVGITNSSGKWMSQHTAKVNAKSFDIASAQSSLKFGSLTTGEYHYRVNVYVNGKCYSKIDSTFKVLKNELAVKILCSPATGGPARNVYTFSSSNCKRLFAVTGYGKAKVPQGMAFDGKKYYFVYGMSSRQAIVTYSAAGKRLTAQKFPYRMGHPNGITWDPVTGVCYIFKGNQKRIHSWNPSNGRFAKLKTPYSSSGIAYDNKTGLLYSTSRSGIRVYTANGSFNQKKLIPRCSHGIYHYIQDCGAGEGIIFHGVSGANKHSTNFLDIYRASDSKYLASIKVTLGELESVVVGNDGYVQLLINNKSTTDYVWRTPLNVKDLV